MSLLCNAERFYRNLCFLRKVFIDGKTITILLHFIHKFSIFFFTTVL